MLKHVHQICHVILHFFLVGPFSGKQILAPATVFYTQYFKPGAKSLISLIHFLFPPIISSIIKVQSSYASTLLLLLFKMLHIFKLYLNLVIGVVRGD